MQSYTKNTRNHAGTYCRIDLIAAVQQPNALFFNSGGNVCRIRYFDQPIRHRYLLQMDSSALGIAVQAFHDWFCTLLIDSYLSELALVGMRVLRAETAVAEYPAVRRSPVNRYGSQSNASFSSAYTRPR